MDKNYLGHAIWIGTVGLLVVAWVLLTGTPTPTQSTQLGYRGNGMDLIRDSRAVAMLAAANTIPASEEPVKPEPGADMAGTTYENVQVLGDLTVDNFNRLMVAITEWVAPEQGCAYCHGEDGNFASDDLYQKKVARRMLEMTRHVNVAQQSHVGATGVTCYTCHRGQPVPQFAWFEDTAPRAGMSAGADRATQNRPLPVNASTSLPAAALEAYLSGSEEIRVIPTAALPSGMAEPGIKKAEKTYSLMMHVADSLGVNCTYCHNSRSFVSWEASPPARATAWHGIRMVRTLNEDYLGPLASVFPPERLGPKGDAPKVDCKTCHQGAPKPLGGQTMLDNWPELKTGQGAPVYE